MAESRGMLIIFGTICVSAIFPLLVIQVLLFALWRQIVAQLAKIFRQDLKGLVHHESSMWTPDLDRHIPKANIGGCISLDGEVSVDDVLEAVGRSLILDKTLAKPVIPYPELTKYPVPWLGFSFWEDETNFDLRRHITEDKTPLTEQDLQKITTYVLSDDPWPPCTSPWKIILYPNVTFTGKGRVTVIILSMHHCLGDAEGIGIALKLFNEHANMAEPFPKVSIAQVLKLPYTMMDNYISAYDSNDLHLPAKKLSRKRKTVFLSNRIPLGGISPLKIPAGMELEMFRTGVILTGIAGGIRRFMISKKMEIPPFLHLFQPIFLPRMGYSQKNRSSLAFNRVFTGIPNKAERLDKTMKFLNESKNSVLPWTYHMSYKAIGVLPRSLQRIIVRSWQATGVYTEDHLPNKHYTVCASKAQVLEFYNFAGPMPGTAGIFVYLSIFENEVGIRLSVSESLCPSEDDVAAVLDDIVEETKAIVLSLSK